MTRSLTLDGWRQRRVWSLVAGVGMIAASVLTIRHFFNANFPASIASGAFCDINAFFNCDSSAFSPISHFQGVPLGYFGLIAGAMVCLGALFPSADFERTNKAIALANALGVVALFAYSVFVLGSLCLLCSGYYVFSLLSFGLFLKCGIGGERAADLGGYRPSVPIALVAAVVTLAGAWGFHLFHQAKRDAQSGGVAARVVRQYFALATVKNPSLVSPFMTAQATQDFEAAPIRVVEYADFLCPDCRLLAEQLGRLKKEFAGKINIAFQMFPLEGKCNTVVEKDLHPGACDLSYIAAHDPAQFAKIHDEIFANFQAAKQPAWRQNLARRHGVEAAFTDSGTQDLVHKLIATGAEYEKTSDKYAHGIRSTPTMIINNRMVIGTLPYPQLKAIFEAILEETEPKESGRFIENWIKR